MASSPPSWPATVSARPPPTAETLIGVGAWVSGPDVPFRVKPTLLIESVPWSGPPEGAKASD